MCVCVWSGVEGELVEGEGVEGELVEGELEGGEGEAESWVGASRGRSCACTYGG